MKWTLFSLICVLILLTGFLVDCASIPKKVQFDSSREPKQVIVRMVDRYMVTTKVKIGRIQKVIAVMEMKVWYGDLDDQNRKIYAVKRKEVVLQQKFIPDGSNGQEVYHGHFCFHNRGDCYYYLCCVRKEVNVVRYYCSSFMCYRLNYIESYGTNMLRRCYGRSYQNCSKRCKGLDKS